MSGIRRVAFVLTVVASSHLAFDAAGAQTYQDSVEVMREFGRQIAAESPNMRISLGHGFGDDAGESVSRSLAATAASMSSRVSLVPVFRAPPATASERSARLRWARSFNRNYLVRSVDFTPDSAVVFVLRAYNHQERPGQATLAEMRYTFRGGSGAWRLYAVKVDVWTTLDPD